MTEEDKRGPAVRIVYKRKRGGHEGGHGGAWKVAYADFVTAMMALFIVLWIVGQSDKMKNAVAEYFKDPGAIHTTTRSGSGIGILPDSKSISPMGDQNMPTGPKNTEVQQLKMEAEKLAQAIASIPAFEKFKDRIQITVTKEGLRIELIEETEGLFFDIGSAKLKTDAVSLLKLIGGRIGTISNSVAIEGHTDTRPYASASYSNWDLSTDRANAARRVLEENGLRGNQVIGVNGYADRRLKNKEKPLDFSNRRVSILVLFSGSGTGGGETTIKPSPPNVQEQQGGREQKG